MREVGGISSEDLKNTLFKNENELPPLFLPIFLSCYRRFDLLDFSPQIIGGQGMDLGSLASRWKTRILEFSPSVSEYCDGFGRDGFGDSAVQATTSSN